MNEAETRAELIDPALKAAGWGVMDGSQIRREYSITQGRLQGSGQRTRVDIADYILIYKNRMLAVIEAKKRNAADTEGLAQAKHYADKLDLRFTYSTNGQGIYQVDRDTGKEGNVASFPTPDELWQLTFAENNEWRDRFSSIALNDKSGTWQARYYQDIAINKILDAIARGQQRILLTLATGTGKTDIAFQVAWKLFHSRWNLNRELESVRRPRILFLADRNILADQAFNKFAFPEDAIMRITPEDIRKKGGVPKNRSIFFTIFQTFMSGASGKDNKMPYFGDYPADFFDCIIIDECHRGGADDESTWRGILDYFSPAVQLGLTATPKRQGNVDTYAYFGEPVYSYSLKEGINDGFLTPFKVRQIQTTLDDYMYTTDDEIIEGEIESGKLYKEGDFNRTIEIKSREDYRVKLFMNEIDQQQKTIVFCATQDHALLVRDLINQITRSSEPNYCVRVTANDGALGDQYLRDFQDNENTIPTILTTSKKLSTGIDAKNIRNIILMRPVKSIITFKQIIGRGTRLFEGKNYFTIYDFVQAYQHFEDPEWDGEPIDNTIVARYDKTSFECKEPDPPEYFADIEKEKPKKIKVKLSDGKEREIQHMAATSYWNPDGKPVSAKQFLENLIGALPDSFNNEEKFREIWSLPDTRKDLLKQMEQKGFGQEQLRAVKKMADAEDSDLYDVLAYIKYVKKPLMTRAERVRGSVPRIFSSYNDKQREFINFVLSKYIQEGEQELDTDKLPILLELKYGSIIDGERELGDTQSIRHLFINFQRNLYARESCQAY